MVKIFYRSGQNFLYFWFQIMGQDQLKNSFQNSHILEGGENEMKIEKNYDFRAGHCSFSITHK